jgi:steroid delta-isomerase-like uncharacterized protein
MAASRLAASCSSLVDPRSRRRVLGQVGLSGLGLLLGWEPQLVRAQTPAASPGAMGAIAEAWTAAWNSHDSAQVAALFTPDGVYQDMAFGLVAHGTAEVTKFADGFFKAAPDLHIDLKAGFGTDEWAAAEWVFSSTDTGGVAGAPTGKRFSVPGGTIFAVMGGKIARDTDYYNPETVLMQLGLLPAAGTPSAGTPSASMTTTVRVAEKSGIDQYFTDPNGHALYTYKNDTPNTSTCTDQCAANWPPLLSTGALTLPAGVSGTLGTIPRPDGSMQVTYNGMPLYHFAKDTDPEDTYGQGVGGVWFVAQPQAA